MLRILILTIVTCLLPRLLTAQPKSQPAEKLSPQTIDQLRVSEDTLTILAFAVVNDSLAEMRFLACRSLIKTLVRTLKTDNSFHYPFSRLKSVSILAPPDSSFRIFTWQLFVDDSTYRYYGAIQMNQKDLKLFPLIDRSFDMSGMPVYDQHNPDQWYGAVYYNLIPFDTRGGRKYLLFGFDGFSFFDKRKLIDVLSFDGEGKPLFGAAVFDNPKAPDVQRVILEYSAEGSIRLNWDEQYKMILFDNLIPYPNPYTGGIMYIPDGSYCGYKLEKGRWVYVEKVFDQIQEEAPRPEPVLDRQKGKNILGTDGKPTKAKKSGN